MPEVAGAKGVTTIDPGLLAGDPGRPLFRGHGSPLDAARFHAIAACLAQQLPDGPAALNLCERRDNFLIGFVALLMRGHACLLPPSRASTVVAEVMREHPGSYVLDDSIVERCRASARASPRDLPQIPPARIVVVGYTSGTTGRPKANPKTWQSFVASTRLNSVRLRETLGCEQGSTLPWILATVPPQHMYGMEMSVLLPLLGGMGVHVGHPLYPADVAAALEELPEPRVLVTTPVHLRALLKSEIRLPPLGAVVSATAPLSPEMADAVEQRFNTALLEFFGSTETCVIASRRTSQDSSWRSYPGVTFVPLEEGTRVNAPWFSEEVVLQDVLELQDDGNFVVRGRNADMVEVGGKRASLADLTRRLMAVEGVSDAVVFQPDATAAGGVQRLAALVVAEGLTEAGVLAQLAPAMDPVFLPRPLVFVARLPRNDVGKLPRDRLIAALRR
jgi:acyl-coenzyme A synthetase/AMP-(fatty) acid ligase